jgi:hypothetical protein
MICIVALCTVNSILKKENKLQVLEILAVTKILGLKTKGGVSDHCIFRIQYSTIPSRWEKETPLTLEPRGSTYVKASFPTDVTAMLKLGYG